MLPLQRRFYDVQPKYILYETLNRRKPPSRITVISKLNTHSQNILFEENGQEKSV